MTKRDYKLSKLYLGFLNWKSFYPKMSVKVLSSKIWRNFLRKKFTE